MIPVCTLESHRDADLLREAHNRQARADRYRSAKSEEQR